MAKTKCIESNRIESENRLKFYGNEDFNSDDFSGKRFEDCNFSLCRFNTAMLKDVVFVNCVFHRCDFNVNCFEGCDFVDCAFRGCVLDKNIFKGCTMGGGTTLKGCTSTNNFYEMQMEFCIVLGTTFTDDTFNSVEVSFSDFNGVRIESCIGVSAVVDGGCNAYKDVEKVE